MFDLIGHKEPDQTKSLGLIFAKSIDSIKCFLNLLNITINYDRYIVDCEPRNLNNKRLDILIRFYNKHQPVEAIIIEAKSKKH